MKTTLKRIVNQYSIISISSILLSYLFYKIIPINNFNEMSIVSATASLQLWIWFSYLILIVLLYFGAKKMEFEQLLEYVLIYILTIIVSITVSATAMSLKGTPLASGDIRGDLLGMVDFAQYAKEHGWSGDLRASGDFYPPVWTTIVGNLARILNLDAIEIYKPAEFILLIIGPLATLYIWKKLTPSWVALLISIFFASTQVYYWKNIPLHLLIPLIIISLKRVSSLIENRKSIILDHLHGFIIGFLILTYFGNFWWGILFMMGISLVALFAKNRANFLKRQTTFYLSAGTSLIPPTVGSILEISIPLLYMIFIVMIIINLGIENYSIAKFKNLIIGTLIPITYIIAFITFRTNDDWFEGDVASANPTLKMPFSFDGVNLIFILLFLIIFVIALQIDWLKSTAIILVGFCISALLMRYFIASRMQVTNLVDLWPRSSELFNYSFNLLILLSVLAVGQVALELIYSNNLFDFVKHRTNHILYSLILVMFILFGSISNSLGGRIYGSMPINTFNGAWYAHKGCSNPHEDPMLAKVFETRPYIQDYLRKECWGKKWLLVDPLVKEVD